MTDEQPQKESRTIREDLSLAGLRRQYDEQVLRVGKSTISAHDDEADEAWVAMVLQIMRQALAAASIQDIKRTARNDL